MLLPPELCLQSIAVHPLVAVLSSYQCSTPNPLFAAWQYTVSGYTMHGWISFKLNNSKKLNGPAWSSSIPPKNVDNVEASNHDRSCWDGLFFHQWDLSQCHNGCWDMKRCPLCLGTQSLSSWPNFTNHSLGWDKLLQSFNFSTSST